MNTTRTDYLAAEDSVGGITRSVPVKPQSTGTKQVPPEKPKAGNRKPGTKKAVVQRRAPARGKYIDEYARPAI